MLSSLRNKFLGRQECRVIVAGLDGAGKTSIVHRLKFGKLDDTEIIRTRPHRAAQGRAIAALTAGSRPARQPARHPARPPTSPPLLAAAASQPPSASTSSASSTAR